MEATHRDHQAESPDEELVQTTISGNSAAFEELVSRYTGMVFALCYARTGDRDIAEDLVQEVFLRAYLGLPSLSQPKYFATWLSRITRNLAADWQRRRIRRSQAVSLLSLDEIVHVPQAQILAISREHESQERQRDLDRALSRLSPEQREIILLHFAEDWSLTDISARLNVHRTTVRRHLEQALSKLREDIEPMLRNSCRDARAGTVLTGKATAAIAAIAAMPEIGRAQIIAQLPPLATSTATGAQLGTAATAKGASILQITGAATAAGGTIVVKKSAVVAAAVILGLLGAGYYAKEKLSPYYGSGGTPPPPGMMASLPTQAPNGTISIKPATSSRMAMSSGNGSLRATAMDLQNAVANCFPGYGRSRIVYDGVQPTGPRFDISASAPASQPQALSELLKAEVPKAFGVNVRPEQREMDVLVMTAPNGDKLMKPGTGFGSGQTKPGEAVLTAATTKTIADTIAGNTKVPVLDETGLTGRYDVNLKAKMQDKDSVVRAVREQLGLELQPARRKVDLLVVTKAG